MTAERLTHILFPLLLCACGKPPAAETAPIPPAVGEYATETSRRRESPANRIEHVADKFYRIGRVDIDAARREISFPCAVHLREGIIEVMVCTPWGKTHETIMTTPARPEDLHLALLLLGLRDGSNPAWLLPDDISMRPPKWDLPPGDMLEIFMEWTGDGLPVSIRLEEALTDRRSALPPSTSWVFVGSLLTPGGYYLADQTGTLVANYHDQNAVIDFPRESGREDDFTVANTAILPPLGTTVTLRIAPAASKL